MPEENSFIKRYSLEVGIDTSLNDANVRTFCLAFGISIKDGLNEDNVKWIDFVWIHVKLCKKFPFVIFRRITVFGKDMVRSAMVFADNAVK